MRASPWIRSANWRAHVSISSKVVTKPKKKFNVLGWPLCDPLGEVLHGQLLFSHYRWCLPNKNLNVVFEVEFIE
jgi:hypothetical protein